MARLQHRGQERDREEELRDGESGSSILRVDLQGLRQGDEDPRQEQEVLGGCVQQNIEEPGMEMMFRVSGGYLRNSRGDTAEHVPAAGPEDRRDLLPAAAEVR